MRIGGFFVVIGCDRKRGRLSAESGECRGVFNRFLSLEGSGVGFNVRSNLRSDIKNIV